MQRDPLWTSQQKHKKGLAPQDLDTYNNLKKTKNIAVFQMLVEKKNRNHNELTTLKQNQTDHG
jgi:hypothetical protein